MTSEITTLIIPAAGAGTRLRPITYVTPKELVRLVDKPIAYYLLAEAHTAGISRIIFITHVANAATKNFFTSESAHPLLADFPGMEILFIETTERRGDGQALLAAKDLVRDEEAFAITMGDLITLPGSSILKELRDAYAHHGSVFSVMDVPQEMTQHYGIITPSTSVGTMHRVKTIVEKPTPAEAPSTLAMNGKYILTADIFSYLETISHQTPIGEIKLAHALDAFAQTHALHALECATKCFDTGIKSELFKTEIVFTLAHPELGATAREILKDF